MPLNPDGSTNWQIAEARIVNALGLRFTAESGRFFWDFGDATTANGESFQLITDSKATQHKSYAVNRDFMREMADKTIQTGKRFALHIQFQQENRKDQDWVVIGLDDFAELVTSVNDPVVAELPELTYEQEEAFTVLEELAERIKDAETKSDVYQAIAKLRNGR